MRELRPIALPAVRREIRKINATIIRMTPIDSGIEDLVAGLIRWGIRTYMSCQGHKRGIAKLPYVDVAKRHASRALDLAGLWSLQPESRYVWALTLPRLFTASGKPDGGAQDVFRLQPMRRKDLAAVKPEGCRKDARAFGRFLLRLRRR